LSEKTEEQAVTAKALENKRIEVEEKKEMIRQKDEKIWDTTCLLDIAKKKVVELEVIIEELRRQIEEL
jgi:hypothetical protein